MLTVVPQPADRLDEPWLVAILLLPLLGLALALNGAAWGLLFVGAAVSLALCRFGPHWWPGRR